MNLPASMHRRQFLQTTATAALATSAAFSQEQTPSHPDPAPRLAPTRPAPLKSNFLAAPPDPLTPRPRSTSSPNSARPLKSNFLAAIAQERNGGNTVVKRYATHGLALSDDSTYFYTRDHLGSIRQVTDEDEAVVEHYRYDPYGVSTASAPGGPNNYRLADFRYTGHHHHEKSSLHLAMHRAYDAELGVWISEDPIQEQGGLNLYGYVENSAILWIDWLGLDPGVVMIAPDQSNPKGLQKLIDSGKAGNPFAGLEDAAKAKGMKVCYNASTEDVKSASQAKDVSGKPKNDEVIFYTHGSPNGNLGLSGGTELGDVFGPTDGGTRTMLSCHLDKVVSPERIELYRKGGTKLKAVPVDPKADGTVDRHAARPALENYLKNK